MSQMRATATRTNIIPSIHYTCYTPKASNFLPYYQYVNIETVRLWLKIRDLLCLFKIIRINQLVRFGLFRNKQTHILKGQQLNEQTVNLAYRIIPVKLCVQYIFCCQTPSQVKNLILFFGIYRGTYLYVIYYNVTYYTLTFKIIIIMYISQKQFQKIKINNTVN